MAGLRRLSNNADLPNIMETLESRRSCTTKSGPIARICKSSAPSLATTRIIHPGSSSPNIHRKIRGSIRSEDTMEWLGYLFTCITTWKMHNKLILSVGLLAVITISGLATITLGVIPVHAADPHTVGSISLNSNLYPVPFSSHYSENEDISQFPLHPFSWTDLPLNSKDRSLAGGDVTVRIVIIDNEYDLSAGNDIIREDVRDLDGDGVPDAGPVKISITRGAEEFPSRIRRRY